MIEWIGSVPVFFFGAFVMFLPGLPVAAILRFRGIGLAATSIAASFAIIALMSITAPLVNLSWSIGPVILGSVTVSIVVGGLCWLLQRNVDSRGSWRMQLQVAVPGIIGFIIAAGLIAWVLIRSIGLPDALSQNYDSPFHVNTVQHILQVRDASPFHTDLTSHNGHNAFYPTLWHAFVALITQLSGATPVVATNVASVLVASVVWPIAMLFFSQCILPRDPMVLLFTSVLIPLFASFPYRFFNWGLLYPNLLSTALLPIALGLGISLLKVKDTPPRIPGFSLVLAGSGALAATVLAQPNGLFAAAALLISPVLIFGIGQWKRASSKAGKLLSALLPGMFIGAVILMWVLVSTSDNKRSHDRGIVFALKEGLITSPFVNTDMWVLGALVVVGAILALRSPSQRWLFFTYLTVLLLFTVSMTPHSPLRTALVGAWYNDAHRLAGLLPVAGIPLASLALYRAFDYVRALQLAVFPPERAQRHSRRVAVALSATAVLLFLGQLLPALRADISPNFQLTETSRMVTPDERKLFELIGEVTPENALIASDPSVGSTYIYALTGRELLFPHFKGNFSDESRELALHFTEDPERSCELINSLGVTHFVGSTHPLYAHSQVTQFSGLQDLDNSPILEPVERIDEATLYAVTGCN